MAAAYHQTVASRHIRSIWSGIRPLAQDYSVATLNTLGITSIRIRPWSSPKKPLQRPVFNTTIIAPFHSSSRRRILPPGPQVMEGGVNDPAPVPEPSPTHGSYHWVFERAMSAALIPLTIAPFAAGTLNPVMDAILCAGIILHSHIGFQSVIIDYIPDKRLPKTRAMFWWALRAATVVVAVGFFEFETNDVGLTEAIKRIWTAKRKEMGSVEPVLQGVA